VRKVLSTRGSGARAAHWFAIACSLLLLATTTAAHAEPALAVADKLDGIALGRQVALLEDPGAKLTLQDVQRVPERFAMGERDHPGFGYTDSAYWVRLHVRNPSAHARDWLLELAYPHLDDVTLYIVHPDGSYEARYTGDSRPFSSRDLAYRTFLFSLREQAQADSVYYLRVQSSSSLNLSMLAWDVESFLAFQPRDLGMLFLFYGVLAVMACYNLCMWLFIRQAEHLHYVFFILSTGALQFSLSGHTFQFLFPRHPQLAQEVLPLAIASSLAAACFVGHAYLAILEMFPRVLRVMNRAGYAVLLLGPASALLPHSVRVRLLLTVFALLVLFALLPGVLMLRMRVARARLYVGAWSCVNVGFAVAGLRVLGVFPSNLFTEWSCQIGSALQLVLLSSALADRINAMRDDLGALNQELSRKVQALENALQSAENATTRAEHATRVKDEFMATMSHELRTPLNAIINVPQGLLRDFPCAEGVSCGGCQSTFELERDERVTGETLCPECGQPGTLKPKLVIKYSGKPEHTSRYLALIERSGKHLLQMVNGVLDFSKLELGRLELVLESFDLSELVREISDEMSLYAERMGVRLELDLPKSELVVADPVRVKQVLLNLLSNAVKFSDGAGVVQVGLVSRPECVELSVKDQGIGIAAEHFERIFASFEQVHKGNTRKYGGTGLGLSISRSLVRMHGGELWVESELGRGATFLFRIPRGLTSGRSRNTSSRTKSVASQTARHGEEMAS
jgi:two-component system, sensor histidine kinase LadS